MPAQAPSSKKTNGYCFLFFNARVMYLYLTQTFAIPTTNTTANMRKLYTNKNSKKLYANFLPFHENYSDI